MLAQPVGIVVHGMNWFKTPGTLVLVRVLLPSVGAVTYGPCIMCFSQDMRACTATWLPLT